MFQTTLLYKKYSSRDDTTRTCMCIKPCPQSRWVTNYPTSRLMWYSHSFHKFKQAICKTVRSFVRLNYSDIPTPIRVRQKYTEKMEKVNMLDRFLDTFYHALLTSQYLLRVLCLHHRFTNQFLGIKTLSSQHEFFLLFPLLNLFSN